MFPAAVFFYLFRSFSRLQMSIFGGLVFLFLLVVLWSFWIWGVFILGYLAVGTCTMLLPFNTFRRLHNHHLAVQQRPHSQPRFHFVVTTFNYYS